MDLHLVDDDNNITTTAAGATVKILRQGAWLNEGGTLDGFSTADVHQPGALEGADWLYVWDDSTKTIVDTLDPGGVPDAYLVDVISFIAVDGDWRIDFAGQGIPSSLTNFTAGQRFVLTGNYAVDRVTYYEVDVGGTGSTADITVPNNGIVDIYVDALEVDILITGANISTQYVCDHPTESPRPEVDVREFGAVGDGSNDDMPAFQKAVDLASTLGGESIVRVPTGTYLLKSTLSYPQLEMRSGVVMRGDGSTSILKADTTLGATTMVTFEVGSTAATVRDLKFESAAGFTGVYLSVGTDYTVQNVEFDGGTAAATYGVTMSTGITGVRVIFCRIHDLDTDGVLAVNADSCQLLFNYIEDNGQYGINIDASSDNWVIVGNIFSGNSSGASAGTEPGTTQNGLNVGY